MKHYDQELEAYLMQCAKAKCYVSRCQNSTRIPFQSRKSDGIEFDGLALSDTFLSGCFNKPIDWSLRLNIHATMLTIVTCRWSNHSSVEDQKVGVT